MCSGREFQVWAAETGEARLPTVASLTGGTTGRLVPAERVLQNCLLLQQTPDCFTFLVQAGLPGQSRTKGR